MRDHVLPMIVAYRSGGHLKAALRSFQAQFPSWQVLIVDNNDGGSPDAQAETEWIRRQDDVIYLENRNPVAFGWGPVRWSRSLRRTTAYANGGRQHGAGIDIALQFCRTNGVGHLLLLEPDCLVFGKRWLDQSWAGIEGGAWYVGSHRLHYGPIHPCPSIIKVDCPLAAYSARIQRRGRDMDHYRFGELVAMDTLLASVPGDEPFWRCYWDTTQKIWFEAAIRDRAVLAAPSDDFVHLWGGSTRSEPGRFRITPSFRK